MKVKELIKELSKYNGDTEVGIPHFTYGTRNSKGFIKCCKPLLSIDIDSNGIKYIRIESEEMRYDL